MRNRSKTDSFNEQARPLMLPQEINELPYGEELIFVQGTKTTPPLNIRARKIFWYEEEVFKERAFMPLPALPTGDASKIDALTYVFSQGGVVSTARCTTQSGPCATLGAEIGKCLWHCIAGIASLDHPVAPSGAL